MIRRHNTKKYAAGGLWLHHGFVANFPTMQLSTTATLEVREADDLGDCVFSHQTPPTRLASGN